MTEVPPSFPDEPRVFEGGREERFLAVALETLVQDVSPVGDEDVARALGGFSLGDGPPPDRAPEYVELDGRHLTLTNPPFLLADVEFVGPEDGDGGGDGDGEGGGDSDLSDGDLDDGDHDGYALHCAFDSELQLLIEPPVEVTVEGDSLEELLATFEQMIAEIYRTRGRRLEMLDEGVVDPEAFAERR